MFYQNTELKAFPSDKVPAALKLSSIDRSSAALEIKSGVVKTEDASLAKDQLTASIEKAQDKKKEFIVPECVYKEKIAAYAIGTTLLSGAATLVCAGVSSALTNSSALNWPLVATTAVALSYGLTKSVAGLIGSIASWFQAKNSPEILADKKITREVKDQLKEGKGFISRLYYEYPTIAPIAGTAMLVAGAITLNNNFNHFLMDNQIVGLVLAFTPPFHLLLGQLWGLKIDQTKEQLHPELYRSSSKKR